jgi:hypothetical protein
MKYNISHSITYGRAAARSTNEIITKVQVMNYQSSTIITMGELLPVIRLIISEGHSHQQWW